MDAKFTTPAPADSVAAPVEVVELAEPDNDWVRNLEDLHTPAKGEGKEGLQKLFIELTTWQKETFGQATALSKVHHLEEEVRELKDDLEHNNFLHKRLEFADCFLLLFGAANSDGMTYEDICNCIREKLEICKKRSWGKPDENGVVKHLPHHLNNSKMTNDLTDQHLEAIDNSIPAYKLVGIELAATSCAAITVEWMKGFAEWNGLEDWDYICNHIWTNYATEEITTDELINLYFNSLQTPKP